MSLETKTIGTTNGALDVAVQDQTSDIVDYFLCREIQGLTLAQNVVLDSYDIVVTDSTGVVVGTYVCVQEGTRAFQAQILSINANTLTVDTPADFAFTTSALIANRTPDLNVDGSGTVEIASLFPIGTAKWDITRIIMDMSCISAPKDNLFGDLTALTRGVVIRKSNGIHHTIFNAKTNAELKERMYDVDYTTVVGQGVDGVKCRRSFAGQDKNGVVIRLDPENNEKLEILVQDDLTGLSKFRIVAQGHVVE